MGFTMKFPLPADHWSNAERADSPPMLLCMGVDDPRRAEIAEAVKQAVRYALKTAERHGMTGDFDWDAFVQNVVIGTVGYYTRDGR
jgi:hypothetical protein